MGLTRKRKADLSDLNEVSSKVRAACGLSA